MTELKPFKNKYIGDKIILMAPGPTLNIFNDNFGDNYKRCCVNGAILHEEVRKNLDIFIWCGDLDIPEHRVPSYNYIMEIIPKLDKNIIKFVNCLTDGQKLNPGWGIETQISIRQAKEMNFIPFDQTYHKNDPKHYFHKDLEIKGKAVDGMSVCFAAIQILLFMGFEEIILVGFDCGGCHSYKEKYKDDICEWDKNIDQNLVKRWKLYKKFMSKFYKDRKIKVINPKGLKNVFEELKI